MRVCGGHAWCGEASPWAGEEGTVSSLDKLISGKVGEECDLRLVVGWGSLQSLPRSYLSALRGFQVGTPAPVAISQSHGLLERCEDELHHWIPQLRSFVA